jgi:anti-repressor protein
LLEQREEAERSGAALAEAEAVLDKALFELEAAKEPLEEWQQLVNSSGLFSVAVVAKAFGTGPVRLFAFLRLHRFLIGIPGERFNTPYQQHLDAHRAEIKMGSRPDREGNTVSTWTTMITPKGVEYIGKLIRDNDRKGL